MKNKTKYSILTVVAVACCVAPPFITTLSKFPIWVNEPKMIVSGIALLLIFFSCLPFLKQIREYFKSPSATVLWIITFTLLCLFRHIIDELIYVAAAGLIGNVIGEAFFLWRGRYKDRNEGKGEEEGKK